MKNNANLLRKIETIEKEVMGLKLYVLKNLTPSKKKLISLKGILKGIDVTDQDIARAQKFLFPREKNPSQTFFFDKSVKRVDLTPEPQIPLKFYPL